MGEKSAAILRTSFQDYTFLVGSSAVVALLSLGLTIFLTRTLGNAGYGSIALFYMVTQGASSLGVSWLQGALSRFGREEFVRDETVRKNIWSLGAVALPILGSLVLLGLVLTGRITEYLEFPVWGIFPVIFLSVALGVSGFVQPLTQAIGKLQALSVLQTGQKILDIVVIAALWIGITHLSPVHVASAVSVDTMAVLFFFFLWINRAFVWPPEREGVAVRRILGFSLPLLISVGASYIFSWIDIAIVRSYLTLWDVGSYYLSLQMMGFLQQPAIMINTVIGPVLVTYLSEGNPRAIGRYVESVIPKLVFLWSVATTGLILLAGPLFPLAFGSSFVESFPSFRLLCLGMASMGLFFACVPVLITYEKVRPLVIVQILMGLAMAGGCLATVPHWGVLGAASVKASTLVFSSLLLLWEVRRITGKGDMRIAGFFLLPLLAVVSQKLGLPSPFLWVGAVFMLLLIIFTAVQYRLVSIDDLALLERAGFPSSFTRLVERIATR